MARSDVADGGCNAPASHLYLIYEMPKTDHGRCIQLNRHLLICAVIASPHFPHSSCQSPEVECPLHSKTPPTSATAEKVAVRLTACIGLQVGY